MNRVTNLSQFNSGMTNIFETQRRIFDAQLQIGSGRKSDRYAGIASQSGQLLSVEASLGRLNQYIENNKLVDFRLQTMESNVTQVYDMATQFRTLLINALNSDNANDLALVSTAQVNLEQLAGLLNVKQDGRYLFAGSRTGTQPVDLAGLPGAYAIPTADGASAGYYRGDNFTFSVRADDGMDVRYGVTADAAGFEQLMRSIDLVRSAAPGDRARLEHALSVLNQSMDKIPDIRTMIGAARRSLTDVNARHDQSTLYAEQRIGDIENVDITATMTQLNSDQVTLQASYMTISRLTGLNLMQFLR